MGVALHRWWRGNHVHGKGGFYNALRQAHLVRSYAVPSIVALASNRYRVLTVFWRRMLILYVSFSIIGVLLRREVLPL